MATSTAAANLGRVGLPGSLQVSFVVEAERFAWWGVEDPADEAQRLGLPPGERGTLRTALPEGEKVVATEVPAAFLEPELAVSSLARWTESAGAAKSLRIWAELARTFRAHGPVDELTGALPTAGHAALGLDGTTIWSAKATIEAARRSLSGETPVLRPYQRAGVAWMEAAAPGGGVLADEMGLGKTVQAITVLAARRQRPHLVVCPTSLLGNWARELARFAPEVTVRRFAGPGRRLGEPAPGTVILTSYGVLRGDLAELSALAWDTVILDEAQQIKNPDAMAAKAARALDAQLRVAMTGTPVENRLDELWSLFAFTNPGLLGTRARFRSRFVTAVEQRRSTGAAARLHELVGPHILRRRKVDVAPELPPKIESTVVCALSGEQERLYREALDEAFGSGFGSGFGRRGRVLALLTKLKQICNHPEQVRPEGTPLGGRSGKLDRLTEMLTEITDNGERTLVFTQYRETGNLLARHLGAEVTGDTVPFLHGGLDLPARERLIERFQNDPDGPPVLLLSLRAAGFGLNLTRATHVVHFDRWWNPAVEDQASDRAHRIGQTRTVTVHTLLTERTLEETIAELHAGKRDLAGIATGEVAAVENDLTRLTDEQLRAVLEPGGRR